MSLVTRLGYVLLAAGCSGGGVAIADDSATRSRPVAIVSGEVHLAGTLLYPAAEEPSAGVVLLHGSGPSTRELQRPLAEWFAAHGLVVLTFDKRGGGESGGDWTRASLDDIATDAAAALRSLRQQPEVGERAGLFGHSQAGWVIPRAVALGARPDFVLVVAGGGARPRTVETYGYRNAFEHAGLSDSDRELGFHWIERYMSYLESCTDRETLARGLEEARNQPWYEYAPLETILVSEANCSKWRWVATYDPLPDIARLRMPILVLLGGRDPFGPARISAARWEEGLLQAGNSATRVEVLPDAGHDLGLGPAHGPATEHAAKAEARSPGYLDVIARWLESAGVTPLD